MATAPLHYGRRSANINISTINIKCAFRKVSASNPPHRKLKIFHKKRPPFGSLFFFYKNLILI